MSDDNEIILSEEQKLKILEALNADPEKPPLIKDLIILAFGQSYDARTKYGLAIRKFVGEHGLKFRGSREWIPEKNIVLTEEQKIFIGNNCNSMMPLEMARILFKNPELTNLDYETRAIQKYIKELPTELKLLPEIQKEEINIEDYKPPKTMDQTILRINRYVISAEYHKDNLSERQKKEIKKLMQYLHIHRFLVTINEYETIKDRELFESEYVRGVYNKANLTQEQLDQYIMYASAVVDEKTLGATIKQLRAIENECLANKNTTPQGLADRLNDLSDKYEKCIKRQNDLLKSLEGERKEQLKNQNQVKETVADILAFFQNEIKRQHLFALAQERREKVKAEINRIKSMDDIKAEMFGITEAEILD